QTASPPPPPGPQPASPPPPPGPRGTAGSGEFGAAAPPDTTAVACMRAMIAAAWADGSLDGQERAAIFNGLDSYQLTPEETAFLHRELADPKSIAEIVASVTTPEQATAVYTAACMAIVADTAAEHAFLDELAARLRIDPNTAHALRRG
ncbi:MAG: tellurite resistance TerB family protein, partial [Desulfovibrio sp.]|nr:tellurite resistance TerB family protein [Desulfovibrio sp.]